MLSATLVNAFTSDNITKPHCTEFIKNFGQHQS